MEELTPNNMFIMTMSKKRPDAYALINGNNDNPDLFGEVNFYNTQFGGILVNAEIYGLPPVSHTDSSGSRKTTVSNFYGMHIHENGDCSLPFDKTGAHYNPENALHPFHAGDMPSLLGNNGYAWLCFYDKRFTIKEIIGKSVIIHEMPDDFTTQPSGNSGTKIGCGIIKMTL